MSTTNLFVELIVIGVGAALWVLLLLLSVFGYDHSLFARATSSVLLVPALAFVYLLGIITDRLADFMFEHVWAKRLCSEVFKSAGEEGGKSADGAERDFLGEYHRARIRVIQGSERLAELLEYGRSRMRICRGWSFNAPLIAVSLNVFALSRLRDNVAFGHLAFRVSWVGSLLLLALGLASWFSWRELVRTNYKKTQEQARYLAQSSVSSVEVPGASRADTAPSRGPAS